MQTDAIEKLIDNKIAAAKKEFGADVELVILEVLGLQKLLIPGEKKESREIPLTMWNDYHPDPSIPALRMLVFRKDENGFDMAMTRRGKRILIIEDKYFEWKKLREEGKL